MNHGLQEIWGIIKKDIKEDIKKEEASTVKRICRVCNKVFYPTIRQLKNDLFLSLCSDACCKADVNFIPELDDLRIKVDKFHRVADRIITERGGEIDYDTWRDVEECETTLSEPDPCPA